MQTFTKQSPQVAPDARRSATRRSPARRRSAGHPQAFASSYDIEVYAQRRHDVRRRQRGSPRRHRCPDVRLRPPSRSRPATRPTCGACVAPTPRGNKGPWSVPAGSTSAPAHVTMLAPTAGSSASPNGAVLQWQPVSGAATYSVTAASVGGSGAQVARARSRHAYAPPAYLTMGAVPVDGRRARRQRQRRSRARPRPSSVDSQIQAVQAPEIESPDGTGVGKTLTIRALTWNVRGVETTYQWLRERQPRLPRHRDDVHADHRRLRQGRSRCGPPVARRATSTGVSTSSAVCRDLGRRGQQHDPAHDQRHPDRGQLPDRQRRDVVRWVVHLHQHGVAAGRAPDLRRHHRPLPGRPGGRWARHLDPGHCQADRLRRRCDATPADRDPDPAGRRLPSPSRRPPAPAWVARPRSPRRSGTSPSRHDLPVAPRRADRSAAPAGPPTPSASTTSARGSPSGRPAKAGFHDGTSVSNGIVATAGVGAAGAHRTGHQRHAGGRVRRSPSTRARGRSSPAFTYQWLRNGAPIPGATSGTYRLTAADAATRISLAGDRSSRGRDLGQAVTAPVAVAKLKSTTTLAVTPYTVTRKVKRGKLDDHGRGAGSARPTGTMRDQGRQEDAQEAHPRRHPRRACITFKLGKLGRASTSSRSSTRATPTAIGSKSKLVLNVAPMTGEPCSRVTAGVVSRRDLAR